MENPQFVDYHNLLSIFGVDPEEEARDALRRSGTPPGATRFPETSSPGAVPPAPHVVPVSSPYGRPTFDERMERLGPPPEFQAPKPLSFGRKLLATTLGALAGPQGARSIVHNAVEVPEQQAQQDYQRRVGDYNRKLDVVRLALLDDERIRAHKDRMARLNKPPTPRFQSITYKGENGPQFGSFNPLTHQYFSASGEPISNAQPYEKPRVEPPKRMELVTVNTGGKPFYANRDPETGRIYDPDTGEEIHDAQPYFRPRMPRPDMSDEAEAYLAALQQGQIKMNQVPAKVRGDVMVLARERGVKLKGSLSDRTAAILKNLGLEDEAAAGPDQDQEPAEAQGVRQPGNGRKMTPALAQQYLEAAGGDRQLALQWATEDGWNVR